jgi:preprotein translocase subunit SecG
MAILLMILLFLIAFFLIVLVLIQRGKGGGLAGAFGGMGGQSAFGTKAGDLFTKITAGMALAWILLCMVTVKWLGATSSPMSKSIGGDAPAAPAGVSAPPDADVPAEKPPAEPGK